MAFVQHAAGVAGATAWPLLRRAISTLQADTALQVLAVDAPWLVRGAVNVLAEVASGTGAIERTDHVILALQDPATDPASPAIHGRTLVSILAKAGYRVVQVGAAGASESQIRDRLTIDVLMVCTGNTCRSPMAEAIARHIAERLEPGSVPIAVRSAGVAASTGDVYSSEIRQSLENLRIAPPPRSARSQSVTQHLVEQADVIYAMTSSHLERIHRLFGPERDGGSIGKAMKLDPAGSDVPDPIGQGQAIYDLTARKLLEMISQRLTRLSQGDV